jgi:diguanylate cyclase (GGDEF)-like protein/PAS domain S-box-containing protein
MVLTKILKTTPQASALVNGSFNDAPIDDDGFYRLLIDNLTAYSAIALSPSGIVMDWNSGAQATFGYTRAEVVGRSIEIIFTAEDVRTGAPGAELAAARTTGCALHDRWQVCKDGSRFWGSSTLEPVRDAAGSLVGFIMLVRDTTASHEATQLLADSEQQLRMLVGSLRDYAIFSVEPDGAIKTWSAGAARVFGYEAHEIVGRNFSILFTAADVESGAPLNELSDARRSESIDVERWLVRHDGSTFLATGKTSALRSDTAGEQRGFAKIIHDTTAHHLAVQEIRRRAEIDQLTNLPNRHTFYEHVQRAIATFKRRSSSLFAVLFIDLDHFRAINDEFGHEVADQVLTVIARRLETCVRSEDVLARIGGDEFAILLNGINGSIDATDAARRILQRMGEAVETPVGDVFAATSIGIAMGSAKYDLPQDILRDADAAMYIAKSQGRGRAVEFDESIGNVIRENADLNADLRHAIKRNELRLAFQPVVRLWDEAVIGFEALVRWKHPRRGLLSPSGFIPQAEETNLIVAVDRWVLTAACEQFAQWRERGVAGPELQLSVNVSSKEFSREEFFADVRDVVTANRLDPQSLRLEITEGTIMERSPRSNRVLSAIRDLGVYVDVDDFGTGYASLGSLNNIVVDGLKIDWSFVTNMKEHHGWEIVQSVVSLAHKLGLVATAEGIETREQLRQLIALGCDNGQGYFFSPPVNSAAAADLLRQQR